MRGNCTPVCRECIEYLLVAAAADAGTHDNHQIMAIEQLLMQAKTLSYQALDTVSFDCTACRLDRHGGTEPRMSEAVADSQNRNQAISGLDLAAFEHLLVLLTGKQPATARVARRCSSQGNAGQTDRRARPFARRALITRRPPLVRIRARKPWVRLRLRLLG